VVIEGGLLNQNEAMETAQEGKCQQILISEVSLLCYQFFVELQHDCVLESGIFDYP